MKLIPFMVIFLFVIIMIIPTNISMGSSTFNLPQNKLYKQNSVTSELEIVPINSSAKGFCISGNYLNNSFPIKVSGRNYYVNTGVSINTNLNNFTIPLYWNENNSYTLTQMNMEVKQSDYFYRGTFGLESNSSLVMECGNSSFKGPILNQNHIYYFEFQLITGKLFLSIVSNSVVLSKMLISGRLTSEVSPYTNITFFGKYYTLGLQSFEPSGSINVCNNNCISPTSIGGNCTKFKNMSNSVETLFPLGNSGTYLMDNGSSSIYLVNPTTDQTDVFQRTQGTIVQGTWYDGLFYWLIRGKNGNGILCEYNHTGNEFTIFQVAVPINSNTHLTLAGNNSFIWDSTNIYEINSNGSVDKHLSVSNISGISVDGICKGKHTYYAIGNSSNEAINLNLQNGKICTFTNYSYLYKYTGSSGLLHWGMKFPKDQKFIFYPVINFYSRKPIICFNSHQIDTAQNNTSLRIFLTKLNSYYFLSYSGILEMYSPYFIYSYSGGYIRFYSNENNTEPGISVSYSSSYLFSPLGRFNYTDKSGKIISSHLVISNNSYCIGTNDNISLNLSYLKSGIYPIKLTMESNFLYYYTYETEFIIDNSYPSVSFTQPTNSGVFGGEKLTGSILDNEGLRNATIAMENNSSTQLSNQFNISVPFIHGSYLNLRFQVIDKLGVMRNLTLKLKYYNESLENIALNLGSNSVLNKNSYNFSVTGEFQNVSEIYLILYRAGNIYGKFNVSFNATRIPLKNGQYNYSLQGISCVGNNIVFEKGNFSVYSFKPGITERFNSSTYYSFYGNSQNNTFYYHFSSNLTGNWTVNLSRNSTIIFQQVFSGSSINVTCEMLNGSFRENGIYRLKITFNSINEFNKSYKYEFNVSNEIPKVKIPQRIFTNISSVNISEFCNSAGFSIFIMKNNLSERLNGTMALKKQGLNTVTLKFQNKYGNYITQNVTIVYSTQPPLLVVKGWKNEIYNSTELAFCVFSYGKYGNSTVQVSGNNLSILRNSNTFILKFSKDGSYNISIKSTTVCGNENKTSLKSVVHSFTVLKSLSLDYSTFFRSFKGSITLNGNSTHRAQINWYIEGNFISSGRNLNASLPDGMICLKVVASYNKQVLIKRFRVLSFSKYFLLPVILIPISYAIYSFLVVNSDMEEMVSIVMKSQDSTLKQIFKGLRKRHFSRSKIIECFKLLQSRGIITMKKDPDNVERVVINHLNKKE